MSEADRKTYNWIDLNYHINQYKMYEICNILKITMKEYYKLCERVNMPRTTKKIVKVSEDSKTILFVPIEEIEDNID